MSHKDNMDLRNTGDGGWFYAEHELFSVFAPLIGPLGVSVYMAMCRLIPLAAVDPDRQVTERAVMEAACVSKGTAGRMMTALVALGMVEKNERAIRRAATYRLVSLRTLALVGISELRSRLGAPQGGTDYEGELSVKDGKRVATPAQTSSLLGNVIKTTRIDQSNAAMAPEGSDRVGAPEGGTDADPRKITLLDILVPQKPASVPQKQGLVPQIGGVLFKEEKEEEFNTPLPPSQAKGGLLPSLAAGSETKSKNNGLPDERRGVGDADDRVVAGAVAKVMRECGLSAPRLGPVIEAAMRLEASTTDEAPNWNSIAERMTASYARYLSLMHLMAFKPGARKFFAEGMWSDERKWPWDEKRLNERGRL